MALVGTEALSQAVPNCQLDELLSAAFSMTYNFVDISLKHSADGMLEQNKAMLAVLVGRLYELVIPANAH